MVRNNDLAIVTRLTMNPNPNPIHRLTMMFLVKTARRVTQRTFLSCVIRVRELCELGLESCVIRVRVRVRVRVRESDYLCK